MRKVTARYEKYKDITIEWIGKIPEHWELKRHKDNFHLITKRCEDRNLIKVGLENIESQTGRFLETDSEFDGDGIEFEANDILFGKLRPYLAKVYLSEFRGSAVGDIFVYRSRLNLDPNFSRHTMLSHKYIDVINSSTIGAKMPRVSSSFIANLPFATPPLSEQQAIALYLDTKTAQIDRKIDLLTQKAKRYEELKRSLINETVTRGLDKSVPMKDSAIEWIGKIPEHWEIKRLKDLGFLYSGLTGKAGSDFTDEHQWSCDFIPFVNIANNQYISLSDMKKVIVTPQEKQNQVKKDDLFFLMSSENYEDIGKTALLRSDIRATYLNSFCKGFRFTIKKIVPNFANYLLASQKYRDCFAVEGKGFTRINLKIEKVNNLFFLLPPLHEQVKIAEYLDQKTNYIDQIIENFYSQIEIQKELRKTLINDVVTGKIKIIDNGE